MRKLSTLHLVILNRTLLLYWNPKKLLLCINQIKVQLDSSKELQFLTVTLEGFHNSCSLENFEITFLHHTFVCFRLLLLPRLLTGTSMAESVKYSFLEKTSQNSFDVHIMMAQSRLRTWISTKCSSAGLHTFARVQSIDDVRTPNRHFNVWYQSYGIVIAVDICW